MAVEIKNQDMQEITEEIVFQERTLDIDRIARVVKGGRRFRFRALVVVGNGQGQVGIGTGKGADVTAAITKASSVAKKNIVEIPLSNGTIAHEIQSKKGGAVILIKPASMGTGLIAGGVVRSILELAGINNAVSKSLGSSNKINMAYATINALSEIVPRDQWLSNQFRLVHKTKVGKKQ